MFTGEFQKKHGMSNFALKGTGMFLNKLLLSCVFPYSDRDKIALATSACLSCALLNVLLKELTRQSGEQTDGNIKS